MRHSDNGVEEAIQQSKKGGRKEMYGSVSEPKKSPEKAMRKSKRENVAVSF